jgi:hypothetical protein
VPREVHETYSVDPNDPDAEPVRTGYVVVVRESEWDDASRDRALELTEYEETLCQCGCGLPMRIAHDPEQAKKLGFMVHEYKCYAAKAVAQHRRKKQEAHKESPEGWDDGLHYFAVPAKPTDHKKPGGSRAH